MDKPDVGPIEGEPPAELVIEDITVGDGPEAKPGQYVSVHYVGVAHSSGKEFDASYNRGEPFQLPARRRPGHRRLGPGGGRHARRRPPQAHHPPAPGLRRPGRRRRDQAERDAHLRRGPARRAVAGRQAGTGRGGRRLPRPAAVRRRGRRRPGGRVVGSNGSPIGVICRRQVGAARLVGQQRPEGDGLLLAAGGPRRLLRSPSRPRSAP